MEEMAKEPERKSYEPAARGGHISFSIKGKLYIWGGVTHDNDESSMILANNIEQFDPYIEVWSRLNTEGTPHPGRNGAASALLGEQLYTYGGSQDDGKDMYAGVLSYLDLDKLTWSLVSPAGIEGAPMKKTGCGMVHLSQDKLAVIGGYGIPTDPTQLGSTFVKHTRFTDGRGWTNEIHLFDLNQGVWSSPNLEGTSLPPCAYFSLTSINHNRALFFGGNQPGRGRINDLYLIDFDNMEITRIECRKTDPWPSERSAHAACCVGNAGHTYLLITGGRDRNDKALKDMWLFNLSLKKWSEVSPGQYYTQRPPRVYHSTTPITLCPGLVEVIEFGTIFKVNNCGRSFKTAAEITITTFSRVGSEWVFEGVANNSKLGTSQRIREKMLKIGEKARAVADEQVIEEVDFAPIGEERLRSENRLIEQQLAAVQDRERIAMIRLEEVQQQTQLRVEQIEQQLLQAEERARVAERRAHNLQQRAHDAEQHTTVVERRLHEVEQRARDAEERARKAETVAQQNKEEPHWLVKQSEIELTEEEIGRGGWAVVKVANFRGIRVAAKCFYQQILVSSYNRHIYDREMNMAARLRHPNLVQFIGASLEQETIILIELMSISLRVELERGPIEHSCITAISLDVARALNYLHLMQPHPIIHRDISSANVLLDPLPNNQWKAKVSDYGSVNLLRELRTVGPGNPVYAAPEASAPAEQSPKMDIFSFGVLLVEILTNKFPAVEARQQLIHSINHDEFVDLIGSCLREKIKERPSAVEIIDKICTICH